MPTNPTPTTTTLTRRVPTTEERAAASSAALRALMLRNARALAMLRAAVKAVDAGTGRPDRWYTMAR